MSTDEQVTNVITFYCLTILSKLYFLARWPMRAVTQNRDTRFVRN